MDYLHSLWLSRAKERSAAVAIEDATGAYTYAELAERSSTWFQFLKALGMKRGDRLVLVADSSFAAIAILIGCSMSGVIFTVISPELPPGRRQTIVDDLEPALVVLDTNTADSPAQHRPVEIDTVFKRFVVEHKIAGNESAEAALASNPLSVDPAYIVFTSGSTGRPKGIVMSHRAIVAFWGGLIDHLRLSVDKRYASLSPLQFDFALLDIGLCLGSGATLVLPNRGLLRKPALLVEQMANLKITHFSGVPTIWKLILQSAAGSIHKLDTLERIAFAGEHFPAEHMCAIHDVLPKVDFYNIYGQSESIACTFHVLSSSDFRSGKAHMPVGRGHREMEMILVDDGGRVITAPNVPGELYLKGPTLFSGYWKLPEQTRYRLVQNPQHTCYVDTVFRSGDICYFDADGLYYFIGRKDNQIKINGNRVELEEIEVALNRFPGVTNSCVLAVGNGASNDIHAALVLKAAAENDPSKCESSLRSFLAADLPSYMLPKHYHFIDAIPISENGKNNRKQLVDILGLQT